MLDVRHVLWRAFAVVLINFCLVCLTRGYGEQDGQINLIIDTDAGPDDAVAIMMALSTPEVRIIAITSTYGNTKEENVATNVLKILTVANRTDIPVYSGAKRPFSRSYSPSDYFGEDGFGDFDFCRPIEGSVDGSKHASLAMIELAKKYPGKVRILTLGPLTNVALAMLLDKDFGQNVERFYVMGATINEPNTEEPVVQYNFGLDPASIDIFFRTPKRSLPLLLPSEIAKKAKIPTKWRTEILGALPSPTMDFLNKVERVALAKEKIWRPADPMACAAMLRSDLVTDKREARLTPIVCGPHDGAAPVHWQGAPNAEIIRSLDVAGFQQMLMTLLA